MNVVRARRHGEKQPRAATGYSRSRGTVVRIGKVSNLAGCLAGWLVYTFRVHLRSELAGERVESDEDERSYREERRARDGERKDRRKRTRERERGQPLFLRFVRCTLRRIALSIDGWVQTGQRRTTPPSVDPSCCLTLFLLLSRIIDDSSSSDSFLLSCFLRTASLFFSFFFLRMHSV